MYHVPGGVYPDFLHQYGTQEGISMLIIQFTLRSALLSSLFALAFVAMGLRVCLLMLPYGARLNRTHCVVRAVAI